MRNTPAKQVAFGGMMAALALVVMNLGGLIPVATYVCPMLCMLLLTFVHQSCGVRIAWAWYGGVSVLGLLMSPDKEAAAVFLALGYYPILKPKLDTLRFRWLWKGLLFNVATVSLYAVLLHLVGMAELAAEMDDMGNILLIVLLVLGNVTFIALDRLLTILCLRLRYRRR